AHDQIPVFAKRNIGAQTVNFGSRGNQHLLLFLVGDRKNYLGPAHVRLDRAYRALDDELYTNRGREVENDVALIDQFRSYWMVVDRINRVMKTRMTFEVLNVLDRAGG